MHRAAPITCAALLPRGAISIPAMFANAQSPGAAPRADAAGWTLRRAPGGHPDLTGTFSRDDMRGVPSQRPTESGTRRYLTAEEFAEREARNNVARLTEGGTAFLSERGIRSFRLTTQPGYRVLPYECHEGNHALANILSAARAEEAAAADARDKPA